VFETRNSVLSPPRRANASKLAPRGTGFGFLVSSVEHRRPSDRPITFTSELRPSPCTVPCPCNQLCRCCSRPGPCSRSWPCWHRNRLALCRSSVPHNSVSLPWLSLLSCPLGLLLRKYLGPERQRSCPPQTPRAQHLPSAFESCLSCAKFPLFEFPLPPREVWLAFARTRQTGGLSAAAV